MNYSSFLENIRPTIELLYFLSSVGLVAIAAAGLYQLELLRDSVKTSRELLAAALNSLDLAKQDLTIRNKREAITLAAQLSQRYASETLRQVGDLEQLLARKSLRFRPWPLANSTLTSASLRPEDNPDAWLKKLLADTAVRVAAIDVLNQYECLALHFVTGAADEQVVYTAIGKTFREIIESLAPLVIALREGRIKGVATDSFGNIARLYDVWSTRERKKALTSAKEAIGLELERTPDDSLPPIGTTESGG